MSKTLVVLLILGVMSGCAGSDTADDGAFEVALPTKLPHVDMEAFALPLDAYDLSPAESKILADARNQAMSSCLSRFGFTVTFPKVPVQAADSGNSRRYFLWSAKRAAINGYKWPEITEASRPKDPPLSTLALDITSGKARGPVNGIAVPPGGCLGEANKFVAIDNGLQREFLPSLQAASFDRMWKDRRVVASIKGWSECMSVAGFDYDTPKAANDDPRFYGKSVGKLEIRTALADVQCKASHGVIDTMAATETAIQLQLIKKYQRKLSLVQEILAQQRAVVAKASHAG